MPHGQPSKLLNKWCPHFSWPLPQHHHRCLHRVRWANPPSVEGRPPDPSAPIRHRHPHLCREPRRPVPRPCPRSATQQHRRKSCCPAREGLPAPEPTKESHGTVSCIFIETNINCTFCINLGPLRGWEPEPCLSIGCALLAAVSAVSLPLWIVLSLVYLEGRRPCQGLCEGFGGVWGSCSGE